MNHIKERDALAVPGAERVPAAPGDSQPRGSYPGPTQAANGAPAPAYAAAPQPGQWNRLPPAMLGARRWLLWDAQKIPHYANGGRRVGALDSPEDLVRLVSFGEALERWQQVPQVYAGLGFALGPDGTGNVWQGIDLDKVDERGLHDLSNMLPGYVELSPSGRGRHAIGYGRTFRPLGPNGTGIEAYCSGRYFTVTGAVLRDFALVDLADGVEQVLAPRHSVVRTTASAGHAVPVSPQTVTELRSALHFLSADDYKLWIDVGQALRTLGDTGRGMWMEWSATCPEKFDPSEAARKWRGFEPHSLSYRSIFHWAQERGWVNPASNAAQIATSRVEAPAPTTSWTLVGVADVCANPEPPIAFLIEDLLPAREVTLLPADGGAGKSMLTLIAAVCQAMGRPFMGKVVTRCKVVFYSGEDDRRVLRGRLRRVCEHYDVNPAELAQWLLVVDATDNPCLFREVYEPGAGRLGVPTRNLEDLDQQMGKWGARVVVIDNASDTYDANENERQFVRAFVRSLKDIAKKHDAAVWLLAHLDKASVRGDGGKAKFSGSTAWHNSVRSRLLLVPDADRPEQLVLSQEKSNHGRRSADILLARSPDGVLTHAGGGAHVPAATPDEQREVVLGLIRTYYERGQFISASLAANAPTGAYATLSADPGYPHRVDRARLATLLRQAQSMGLLEVEVYEHPTRRGHKSERWRVR